MMLSQAMFISAIADTITNPERVYLKGGQGVMAEIELFKDDNGVDILKKLDQKSGWLMKQIFQCILIKRCFHPMAEL